MSATQHVTNAAPLPDTLARQRDRNIKRKYPFENTTIAKKQKDEIVDLTSETLDNAEMSLVQIYLETTMPSSAIGSVVADGTPLKPLLGSEMGEWPADDDDNDDSNEDGGSENDDIKGEHYNGLERLLAKAVAEEEKFIPLRRRSMLSQDIKSVMVVWRKTTLVHLGP